MDSGYGSLEQRMWRRMQMGVGALLLVSACGAGSEVVSDDSRSALRVGTIGGAPPFSQWEGDGFRGVDIELAAELGRVLGRRVVFVPTSWRTLLRDAAANRFDLAMNGINAVEDRHWTVDFSIPYAEDGLVAMARCDERAEYQTLADLNRPGVTVFVTANGTGAAFALRNFPAARVVQVDTIAPYYDRLAAGDGDILFDSEFVRGENESVCPALGGARFDTSAIAVLFPPGSSLVDDVNDWLSRWLADGTIAGWLERYSASALVVRSETEVQTSVPVSSSRLSP